jgi:translation initiation factor IF-3
VRIRFRGREIGNVEVGRKQLERFAKNLADVSTVEQAPSFEGPTMLMVLAPSKK